MNVLSLLNKARQELESAKAQAAHDQKAAEIARRTAQAAKVKFKRARKLAKLTKKAARKAEDQAAESLEALERPSQVEKLKSASEKLRSSQGETVRRQRRPKEDSVADPAPSPQIEAVPPVPNPQTSVTSVETAGSKVTRARPVA